MIKTDYYLEKPETIASLDQRKRTYGKTDKLDRLINNRPRYSVSKNSHLF
jgi:hypothetical protein